MVIIVSLRLSHFGAPQCAVTYGGRRRCHRLISSLSAASEPSAAGRLLRKFVASSSKTTSLQALSLLISNSSPFSLHLYQIISQTSWFRWNPVLAASLISLLEENDCAVDAQTLLSQAVSGLKSSRDLTLFYCYLIDAYSQRRLKHAALQSYSKLKEMPFSGRRPYEFMIKGLCLLGMPADAEELLQEMAFSGFKPSPFEFRWLVQAYGRAGHSLRC
ncbi:hypothetical protein HPP92_004929 [Vanilla planifolia]|uniref:Pentatricopeptide repeat-containing protein n=1 Tax=Vanilla planifolia TaxID=51239 RepID=A0A835VCQ8_VANPL|nr:hypothetical protein HPP92_004929 [Vanilla planifolia]